MVQKKKNKKLFIIVAVVGVLIVAIGVAVLLRVIIPGKQDPYTQKEQETSSSSTDLPSNDEAKTDTSDDGTSKSEAPTSSTDEETTIDPATVATIDIAPMGITVSYVKGVGGFEYEVLRSASGTRYVEFRSADLVGTKCTNDQGTFVSIVANPDANDSTTIAKTTTVDGTPYGLSLASTTCASNLEKLKEYQQSFSDAFSLLKKTS